jgi:hypothetical protein
MAFVEGKITHLREAFLLASDGEFQDGAIRGGHMVNEL